MPSIDRPSYCDWETSWWWTSSVRYSLPKALQMTYVELCWKIHDDGGSTKKDLGFLARALLDTEDNIKTILDLPHFYHNEDGTISHRTVDLKLGDQKQRRYAGKMAAEARWAKAEEKKNAPRSAGRNAGRNAARNAGSNTYEGGLEGVPERPQASEKRTGGTSASRSSLAPAGRGAGAGTRPAEAGPVHPDAKFPTEYDRNDPESVRAKDGGWIHLPTGDRLPPPKG